MLIVNTCSMDMIRTIFIILLSTVPLFVQARMYNCIDSDGQRVFSDMPCEVTSVGQGVVSNYEAGSLPLEAIPVVLDEQMANKIRYHLTPAEAKQKYCAKYTQAQRARLIQSKQVVLGMYLADVIKVWGAPLANDGNKVLFQDGDDTVSISLLEGCVINIDRDYISEDEFLNPPASDDAVDSQFNY